MRTEMRCLLDDRDTLNKLPFKMEKEQSESSEEDDDMAGEDEDDHSNDDGGEHDGGEDSEEGNELTVNMKQRLQLPLRHMWMTNVSWLQSASTKGRDRPFDSSVNGQIRGRSIRILVKDFSELMALLEY